MPSSTSPRLISIDVLLRRTTIISFPAAFILLLIHGISAQLAFPALGLLPLAASAFLGVFILNRDRVAALGSPIQSLTPYNIFVSDIVIAASLLAFLIPSWIMLTESHPRGLVVLGTYGTVFMMVDFAIHVYLAGNHFLHLFAFRACDCPHCRSGSLQGQPGPDTLEITISSDDAGMEFGDRAVEAGCMRETTPMLSRAQMV